MRPDDPKFAAMAKQLMALHDDKKYAEFYANSRGRVTIVFF